MGESGIVRAGGAALRYRAWAGSGPAAVLIHGASGNLSDMALAFDGRLGGRAAVAFDRPGFGRSAPVADGHLLRPQAAALRAGLRALGHERVVLVGHSYGGAVALDWALGWPEEVAGIALLGAVSMDWGGALGPHYHAVSAPVIGPALAQIVPHVVNRRRLRSILRGIFAPDPVPAGYAERAETHFALRPASFRLNARALTALHRQIRANQPRYPTIRCPVEILHGEADGIVPARIHAAPLSRLLPAARLTLLPRVGHMLHHAAPEIVAGAIARLSDGP